DGARDIRQLSRGGIRGAPHFASADSCEWSITPRSGVDHVGKSVCIFRTARGQGRDLIDFSSVTEGRRSSVEVGAQGTENCRCSGTSPYSARTDEHLVCVLRVENKRSVESAEINVSAVAWNRFQKSVVVVAGGSIFTNTNH